MTKSTLKNISLDDAKEFYSNLRPDNAVFVLIGDFDTSMANELVENALREWKSNGAKATRKNIVFTHIDGIRFRLVNNPELEQATIAIGFKALPVNSDERHGLNLVNYIFGGIFHQGCLNRYELKGVKHTASEAVGKAIEILAL